MAKRGQSSIPARPSGEVPYAEARGVAAGTGSAQAEGDQRSMMWRSDVMNEGAALLAARGRRAIQNRKSGEAAFERERAFHYFRELPLSCWLTNTTPAII